MYLVKTEKTEITRQHQSRLKPQLNKFSKNEANQFTASIQTWSSVTRHTTYIS